MCFFFNSRDYLILTLMFERMEFSSFPDFFYLGFHVNSCIHCSYFRILSFISLSSLISIQDF